MLATHARVKLGIVQQQVGELPALLHKVELRHARGLALILAGGNSQQLTEHVARVIEAQRLVEVAGKNVTPLQLWLVVHIVRECPQHGYRSSLAGILLRTRYE